MIDLISSIDMHVLESLYAIRVVEVSRALIFLTEIGGALFVGGLVSCLCLILLLNRRYDYVAGLVVSTIGAGSAMYSLKHIIARMRPDVWYRAYPEMGFSFPSGHATLAVALYGFCIYLIWQSSLGKKWRIAITALLLALLCAISFSRIYLGVHYLSDIIAGLFLGSIFALMGIFVARQLEKTN